MHTWTKWSGARCATQHIGLSLRTHIIIGSGSINQSLHCRLDENRTKSRRERAYWTMVVIFQYALVTNSTMMGPLKSQSHKPDFVVSENCTKTHFWSHFDASGAHCIRCRCNLHASRRPPNPACQGLLLALPVAFLRPKYTWPVFSWRVFQKSRLNGNYVEVVH